MLSPATARVSCGRCNRQLAVAEVVEVEGRREVGYRIPEGRRPKGATLHDVGPTTTVSDWAALAVALTWDGTPERRRVTFPAHHRCRATPEVRQDRLDALVMAAVASGEPSVTLPG